MTDQELQNKLAILSDNMDGDGALEVFNSFDGSQDVSDISTDNFAGSGSLSQMTKSTKRFGIVIQNDLDQDANIALTPGLHPTQKNALVAAEKYKVSGGGLVDMPTGAVNGDIVTTYASAEELIKNGFNVLAVADDGVIYADSVNPLKRITVSATETNKRVRTFLEFLYQNPTQFLGLHITSKQPEVFERQLSIRKTSPFGSYSEEVIPFQDSNNPINPNMEKIIVERAFQLDKESISYISIPANSKMQITFVAGFVESSATALKNKTALIAQGKTPVTMVKPIIKTPAKPALRPALKK